MMFIQCVLLITSHFRCAMLFAIMKPPRTLSTSTFPRTSSLMSIASSARTRLISSSRWLWYRYYVYIPTIFSVSSWLIILSLSAASQTNPKFNIIGYHQTIMKLKIISTHSNEERENNNNNKKEKKEINIKESFPNPDRTPHCPSASTKRTECMDKGQKWRRQRQERERKKKRSYLITEIKWKWSKKKEKRNEREKKQNENESERKKGGKKTENCIIRKMRKLTLSTNPKMWYFSILLYNKFHFCTFME